MRCIADLHIHSRFSRACSRHLNLHTIAYWCRAKGVDVVSCGDFTHPQWFKELEAGLEEAEPGLYRAKPAAFDYQDPKAFMPGVSYSNQQLKEVRFLISTEVSAIFSQGGQVRRLHLMLLTPSLEAAKKITASLEKSGAKLASDGRPILGMSAKQILRIILEVDERCMMIPAHAWTPWFAVFGSKSGFDSLEECFEELTEHITSIETGLSSDPPMNWQVKNLDKITLVSNSDAHSPQNIAREANVFDLPQLSYDSICSAIRDGDKKRFLYTIEFYPEEGMYHFDGHRACDVSLEPKETRQHKGLCPACKKPLVIGVMNRVEELATRKDKPKGRIPYKSIVGLDDVVAEAVGSKGRRTKKVMAHYEELIKKFGNELNVLLYVAEGDLKKGTLPEIAEGVRRNRAGEVEIIPGYDGVYGQVKLFSDKERKGYQQEKLF